jgi:hypothetical protein
MVNIARQKGDCNFHEEHRGQSEKKLITECLTQRTSVKHKQRSNGESNNNNNKVLEVITRTNFDAQLRRHIPETMERNARQSERRMWSERENRECDGNPKVKHTKVMTEGKKQKMLSVVGRCNSTS